MAVNCAVVPSGMLGIAGVTVIETSAAGVTVRVVDPLMVPAVAVIVVCPSDTLAACPMAGAVALTAAIPGVDEFHDTEVVTSRVLPSLYVAVAANCWLVPRAMEAFAGVTAMESMVAGVTVRLLEPLMDPELAVIVAFPTAVAMTSPVAETVAVAVGEEFHIAVLVRSCVLPSA